MPKHPRTGEPWTCPQCHAGPNEKHRATTSRPDLEDLEQWMNDGVAEATDGCSVEPDGRCPHGHSSWLIVMGMI